MLYSKIYYITFTRTVYIFKYVKHRRLPELDLSAGAAFTYRPLI